MNSRAGVSAPASPTVATPVAVRRRWLPIDDRYLAPLLITCILLGGQISFGLLESTSKTVLAIVVAILTDLILARLYTGRWPHLASSYISGISVGIIIRSPAVWPYALCSMISITSKHVIRVRGRHLWNPSNFGIGAMLFLAYDTVAGLSIQWGNNLWPMLVIWILGSLIIWRLGRLHITLTYVVSFVVLALLRSWVTGHPWQAEVAPITGPMYQLFVFFMITDPKTTVQPRWAQSVVAFAVALVEMILRLNEVVHAPYYALFLIGPAANLVEIWWTSRTSPERPVPMPASPSPSQADARPDS